MTSRNVVLTRRIVSSCSVGMFRNVISSSSEIRKKRPHADESSELGDLENVVSQAKSWLSDLEICLLLSIATAIAKHVVLRSARLIVVFILKSRHSQLCLVQLL